MSEIARVLRPGGVFVGTTVMKVLTWSCCKCNVSAAFYDALAAASAQRIALIMLRWCIKKLFDYVALVIKPSCL